MAINMAGLSKNRERGWWTEKNNRLSVSVNGRGLGEVMKETVPYGPAKAAVR